MRLARLGFATLALAAAGGLLSAAGCSSPVPPTPKGAWQVTFWSGAQSSQCQINQHNAAVGLIDKSQRGDEVTDALDGASVSCTVQGAGTFKVQASASQNGKSLSFSVGSIDKNATPTSPATGTLSYSSPNTAGNPYVNTADTPCKFWFEPNTGETVDTGKVWLAFSCDAVRDDGHDSTCGIKQGYAIFENCSDGSTSQ
jgi:hypothetical protein